MPCASLSTNLSDACQSSIGGIKSIFVTELESIDTLTVSGGTVTSIDLDTGKRFFQYTFRKNTGSFTENITVSEGSGSVFYAPEVHVVFSRLEIGKRNEISLLAQNDLVIIVHDLNGQYWMVGSQNGLNLSTGSAATGTASTDFNGYDLTFTGSEIEPMYSVPANLISALLVPAS